MRKMGFKYKVNDKRYIYIYEQPCIIVWMHEYLR